LFSNVIVDTINSENIIKTTNPELSLKNDKRAIQALLTITLP
jgi:hypothetical protein